MTPRERFAAHVDWVPTTKGCIEWVGYRNKEGYGRFGVNKKLVLAHRFAWMLEHGTIAKGKRVLHSCDNPSCVNVAHLHVGSHRQNMAEMVARGRQRGAIGESHGRCKLTDAQVLELRALHAAGVRREELRVRFNVSKTWVRCIVTNQWRKSATGT